MKKKLLSAWNIFHSTIQELPTRLKNLGLWTIAPIGANAWNAWRFCYIAHMIYDIHIIPLVIISILGGAVILQFMTEKKSHPAMYIAYGFVHLFFLFALYTDVSMATCSSPCTDYLSAALNIGIYLFGEIALWALKLNKA